MPGRGDHFGIQLRGDDFGLCGDGALVPGKGAEAGEGADFEDLGMFLFSLGSVEKKERKEREGGEGGKVYSV